MITYKCNNNNKYFYKNNNNLENFSNILEIISINETNNYTESNILNTIKEYEIFTKVNDYSDLKCPLCKHDNIFHYHKTYKRNFIFNMWNYEVNAILTITVLECSYCKNNNKGKQLYHSLLPIDVLPYHTYSSNFILNTLQDRLLKGQKIQEIIESKNISHQLFYKWLKGLKLYTISASTILGIKKEIIDVIREIMKDLYSFLFQFFENFYHPFFLFRLTCVPLVIMP